MKTVLVTGGAGFLGRHVCKRLLTDENTTVICMDNLVTGNLHNIEEFLDHPRFEFIEFDITNPFSLQKGSIEDIGPVSTNRIDEIYHLACIASPDKYKFYSIETLTTSFEGTKNILELAKYHNSKFLFTSTSEIYGDPLVHPQPEEYYGNVNTVGERSCYDEGKRVAETLIYEYRKKFGLDLKIVRLFNTYGPYMDIRDGRVITNFIDQIRRDLPVKIYGNGLQTRSFCYVDDLMDGLFAMMASGEVGPINLGNPNCEFTLLELVQVFEKVMEKTVAIDYLDFTENDPKQRKPDIEKAAGRLGFCPKVGLEEGIKKTVDYFVNKPN